MRLLGAILLGLSWVVPAQAQFANGSIGDTPGFNNPAAVSGGGGGSVTWTPTANPAFQAGTANPQVFPSVAIGPAAANRQVVMCVVANFGGPPTAITVGGTSLTKQSDGSSGSGALSMSLWSGTVATGTTATVNVTMTTAFPGLIAILVGALNASSPTATSTAFETRGQFTADPQTTYVGGLVAGGTQNITIASGGIGLGCFAAATPNASPTGLSFTQDYQVTSTTTIQGILGHISTSGSQRFSISGYTFGDDSWATGAFGP